MTDAPVESLRFKVTGKAKQETKMEGAGTLPLKDAGN